MSDSQQAFFTDAVSEKLFQSLVALAAEVNVLRDRVARLEGRSECPNPSVDADAFVQHVFGGLAKP